MNTTAMRGAITFLCILCLGSSNAWSGTPALWTKTKARANTRQITVVPRWQPIKRTVNVQALPKTPEYVLSSPKTIDCALNSSCEAIAHIDVSWAQQNVQKVTVAVPQANWTSSSKYVGQTDAEYVQTLQTLLDFSELAAQTKTYCDATMVGVTCAEYLAATMQLFHTDAATGKVSFHVPIKAGVHPVLVLVQKLDGSIERHDFTATLFKVKPAEAITTPTPMPRQASCVPVKINLQFAGGFCAYWILHEDKWEDGVWLADSNFVVEGNGKNIAKIEDSCGNIVSSANMNQDDMGWMFADDPLSNKSYNTPCQLTVTGNCGDSIKQSYEYYCSVDFQKTELLPPVFQLGEKIYTP